MSILLMGQREDGGVEGLELTSCHENSRITTNWWTTIDKKDWNLQKKDILCPKTKKPQEDGRNDPFGLQSNPIHTEWETHKLENDYIKEVLPQEWEFWAPHQAPQSGCLALGGGERRAFVSEGQWGMIAGTLQDWGNRNSTLGGHAQGLTCTGTRGTISDFIGAWVAPTCWSWRVTWGGRGWLWLTVGTRTLVAEILGSTHWCELSWRLSFWHQDLAPPNSL